MIFSARFDTEASLGLRVFPHRLIYNAMQGTTQVSAGLDVCMVTASSVSNKIQMGDILLSLTDRQQTTSLCYQNLERGDRAILHTEASFETQIDVIASTVPPRRLIVFRLHSRPALIDAAMKSILDETSAVTSSTVLTDDEARVFLGALAPGSNPPETSAADDERAHPVPAPPAASAVPTIASAAAAASSSSAAAAALRNWFESDPGEAASSVTDADIGDAEPHPPPSAPSPAEAVSDAASLPAGWRSAVDPSSGRVYYYNEALQASQFEFPTQAPPDAGPTAPPEVLPPGWRRNTDAATGLAYYYNYDLNLSQWESPEPAPPAEPAPPVEPMSPRSELTPSAPVAQPEQQPQPPAVPVPPEPAPPSSSPTSPADRNARPRRLSSPTTAHADADIPHEVPSAVAAQVLPSSPLSLLLPISRSSCRAPYLSSYLSLHHLVEPLPSPRVAPS